MAASENASDDEDDKLRRLDKEIIELRSSKKHLFEKARPINDELQQIARRERECVDTLHRLMAEKHEQENHRQTVERLVELQSPMKQLKCENDTLKRDNVAATDLNRRLKQSLDQSTEYSRVQKQKIMELREELSAEQELRLARETVDGSAVRELQKQLRETRKLLHATKDELNETRQRLSDVQERLTVDEQVTAATQRRALEEADNSEELQLELTSQHRQPATCTGFVFGS